MHTFKNVKPDTWNSPSSAAGHVRKNGLNKKTGPAGAVVQGKFPVQRQAEEEEPAQGKFVAQRQEEEEPAQGKFPVQRQEEEEPAQGKFTVQRQEEEEPAQGKFPIQASGLPATVQEKMEGALNTSFSSVKVHANSSKASDIGAQAYTQGSDIHVAPGQYNPNSSSGKQLLGHELTHVAQQREGRVQPTGEVGGLPLNDNPSLEKEADTKGAKAV